MEREAPIENVSSGGQLCLDFVDTVDWRLRDPPDEFLHEYADLVAWARREDAIYGGVLDEDEARRLLRVAGERPQQARAALGEAIALREALYRLFGNVARGEAPREDDLAALNRALAHAMARVRVAPFERGYAWAWADDETRDETRLDRMLWPVARSAAELLTAGDLSRVRECAGEGCGWLLYDSSKNRSRRWCTMEGCGNRAKARRHYQRRRAAGSPTEDSRTI